MNIRPDFEDFLMEKHAEQFIGTKDCMVDDFEDWVTNELSVDDIINLANMYGYKLIEDTMEYMHLKRMEAIDKLGEKICQK